MAKFTVDRNVRITIFSTKDAGYNQRFIVERESRTQSGWWEGMGKKVYYLGDSADFVPFTEITTWRITCENDGGKGSWKPSREIVEGVGTQLITIKSNDSYPDSDYNDLMLYVHLNSNESGGYNFGIMPGIVNNGTIGYPDQTGDGSFIQKADPVVPEYHHKGKTLEKGEEEP